jgi:hypothetical protein
VPRIAARAVPIAAALRVLAERVPSLAPVAAFLGE